MSETYLTQGSETLGRYFWTFLIHDIYFLSWNFTSLILFILTPWLIKFFSHMAIQIPSAKIVAIPINYSDLNSIFIFQFALLFIFFRQKVNLIMSKVAS